MGSEWQLITYDIWGNESDGWEVNNSFRTDKFIVFDESIKDKELEELVLSELGMVGTVDNSQSFNDCIYFYDESSGKPEFELRRVIR